MAVSDGAEGRKNTKLLPLEFRVYQSWRERLKWQRVLVACSGGRDSVVLASCLARLASRIGFEVALAHVHHGLSSRLEVTQARDRAREFVLELGSAFSVQVFAPLSGELSTADSAAERAESIVQNELRSEEELRDYRLRVLSSIFTEQGFTRIAFAHHADDLLETRLIRMIRGTGAQGIVSMRDEKDKVIRPLLREPVEALAAYAEQKNSRWIEDPTNSESEALRNWIRNEWLPQLEAKRPGASRALGRSLDDIAHACDTVVGPVLELSSILLESGVARQQFSKLSLQRQRQVLASYILRTGVKGFSSSQIDEILKRLKTEQKSFTFEVAGLRWQVTKELIAARLR